MVTNSSNLYVSYSELESMFNAALEQEINEWKEEKEKFFKDPFNKSKRNTGNYMPDANFKIWLAIPMNLVCDENFRGLKEAIEKAGWIVNRYEWLKDERTGEDKLFIHILKK